MSRSNLADNVQNVLAEAIHSPMPEKYVIVFSTKKPVIHVQKVQECDATMMPALTEAGTIKNLFPLHV